MITSCDGCKLPLKTNWKTSIKRRLQKAAAADVVAADSAVDFHTQQNYK